VSLKTGHPVLDRVGSSGLVALGWFRPGPEDGVPQSDGVSPAAIRLLGNAGPGMFARFAGERDPSVDSLDAWTRVTVDRLSAECGATALYPFDKPALPFLTWARRAGCGHISPLGLNIHPQFGLWHAFRAALAFARDPALPAMTAGPSPCDSCLGKPCLSSCPVGAFTAQGYDVAACARHLMAAAGGECMNRGCLARLACPIGTEYRYAPDQMRFHMAAFRRARAFSLDPPEKI
jgi:ferredoxin